MNSSHRDKFGLCPRDWKNIREVFSRFPQINNVTIFGSRAMGNYKDGSDIDLAVMESGIDNMDIINLKAAFDESDLPYNVDILYYPEVQNISLKDHIDRVGLKIETS